MILVDTSVWVEHFRIGNALGEVLTAGLVLTHPFVAGELSCENLRNRVLVLRDMMALPRAVRASDEEVLRFIEIRRLWGRGIGWVDAHLLASALLTNCSLWTLDRQLQRAGDAAEVELHFGR